MGHGSENELNSYGPQHTKLQPFKLFWDSGVALIASAAFLFSCTSLAVKLLGNEVPTFQIVFVPGLLCFCVTSAVVKWNGLSVRSKSWRIAGLTLLRGLLGATSITCFYLAIELLPLQDAVTLFFCSPVVATLLEILVTGEAQGWACAAATACTVAGVVLVAQPSCVFSGIHGHSGRMSGGADADGSLTAEGATPGSQSGTSAAGVALATAAAIANAAAFVVVRLIRQSQSTLILTWWYHGVVLLVSAIPLLLRYPSDPVLPNTRGWLLLLVVALTQLVGQLLLNRGFQLESATRGSAINVLQVLFSFLWDVTALGDKPGAVSMAGSSLVAAGVLFAARTGNNRPGVDAGSGGSEPRRRQSHADEAAQADIEEPLIRPTDLDDTATDAEQPDGASAAAANGGTGPAPTEWGVCVVADSRSEGWAAAGSTSEGPSGSGSRAVAGGGGASRGGGGSSGGGGSQVGRLEEPLLPHGGG